MIDDKTDTIKHLSQMIVQLWKTYDRDMGHQNGWENVEKEDMRAVYALAAISLDHMSTSDHPLKARELHKLYIDFASEYYDEKNTDERYITYDELDVRAKTHLWLVSTVILFTENIAEKCIQEIKKSTH